MKIVQFHQCPLCDDFECESSGWFVIDRGHHFGPFGTEAQAQNELEALDVEQKEKQKVFISERKTKAR